jgi:hypothetical protein
MIVETKFSIGDWVWDTLTSKRTRVTGIRVEKGELCCSSGFKNETIYVVKDHLCHTFRKEGELLKAD